jgi:hypothetical protein
MVQLVRPHVELAAVVDLAVLLEQWPLTVVVLVEHTEPEAVAALVLVVAVAGLLAQSVLSAPALHVNSHQLTLVYQHQAHLSLAAQVHTHGLHQQE